jgi:hypothetical protein
MHEIHMQRTELARAHAAQTEQLDTTTLERDRIKDCVLEREPVCGGVGAGTAGALHTPFLIFQAPGSGLSMEASSATSGPTSVNIQGTPPKNLCSPITSAMVRGFHDFVKVAVHEGRTVRYEVLISAVASA